MNEELRSISMPAETVRNITTGLRRDNTIRQEFAKPFLSRLRDGWDKLDVDEIAHTIAVGRDEALASEVRAALRGTPLGIDPITRRLLKSIDLDPDGALYLSAIASPDTINLKATLRCSTPGAPTSSVTFPLNAEVSWHAPENEIFMLGPIPETLANALVGRPLRDWLSHPILDDYDISITSVRVTSIATRVRTDAIEAIAALDPEI